MLCGLRSAEQVVQRLIEAYLSEILPSRDYRGKGRVVGFALQGASDHQFSFLQVHVVIRPHVPQVIACFRRVLGIERYRFTKQIGRFVVQARLFGSRSIIEVELRVYEIVVLLDLCFVQRLLESGYGLLALFCFALRDPQVIDDLRCARESAPGFSPAISLRGRGFVKAEKQFRQAHIRAGVIWINQETLLIIGGDFGELRFGFLDPIRALKRSRFLVEHLSQ